MQAQYKTEGQKRLHTWMETRNYNKTDTAKLLGLSYASLWHLVDGNSTPLLRTAIDIEKMTKGYVRPKMWLLHPVQQKKTKPTNKSESQHAKKHDKDTRQLNI